MTNLCVACFVKLILQQKYAYFKKNKRFNSPAGGLKRLFTGIYFYAQVVYNIQRMRRVAVNLFEGIGE